MPEVTIVVPTLAADGALLNCLDSLARQTCRDFEVTVVDNSARQTVRRLAAPLPVTILEPPRNLGFGAAINLAFRNSNSPFLATLNDDAMAEPAWLESLLQAARDTPEAGMFASQVRLDDGALDSAGMLLARDGSSRQRGHQLPPAHFTASGEAFLPSASAALYRRSMLDETGAFDDRFFLYCEDTDLGLRARWAGWRCRYVAGAVVYHRYSHTAGRVSPLKAYYVERNRLFLIVKNFPLGWLLAAPLYSATRYFWHLVTLFTGRGAAADFHRDGSNPLLLIWFPFRAHAALVAALPYLCRERRRIRRTARISPRQFRQLAELHRISTREVAAL